MSKKKNHPLLENLLVTDVAAEGKALIKTDDKVIFTQYAVPGDVVDVQITRKKNRYLEGRVVAFKHFSEKRAIAFCEHYGICGGCKWQILPYSEQLKYKQKQVVDNLTRIGKVELPEISPILGSKKTTFYRNKLEFTFSNKRWMTMEEIQSSQQFDDMNALGFHIPNMFDKVLDIKKCWLQEEFSNKVRLFVKDFALTNQMPFFDLKNQNGLLRNIIVRTSSTGEKMLIVVFFSNDEKNINLLLNAVADEFLELTSIIYIVNSKANDSITDQTPILFKGNDFIMEQMENLKFKIGAKSFYQTNSDQAYELYKQVRSAAKLSGEELVYDLYTGTGTIANFVAKSAKKVIGIEYVPEAIEDAKENSAINHIENTEFFAGDMKDILTESFLDIYGKPDVVITDPPRAGMHEDVIKTILLASPQRIVYVSCNPATQARDLNLLDEMYRVSLVQPVDMFPHTHHVENIVCLEKREKN